MIHFDPELGQLGGPQARLVPPPEEGDGFVLDLAFGPADVPRLANTVWMATRTGGVVVLDHNGTLANKGDDVWNLDRGDPLDTHDGLAGGYGEIQHVGCRRVSWEILCPGKRRMRSGRGCDARTGQEIGACLLRQISGRGTLNRNRDGGTAARRDPTQHPLPQRGADPGCSGGVSCRSHGDG